MVNPTQDRAALLKEAYDRILPTWSKDSEFMRRVAQKYSQGQLDELVLLCMALRRLFFAADSWPLQPVDIDQDQLAAFEESCAAVANSETICRDFLTPKMKDIVSQAVPYAREIGGPFPEPWDPVCGGDEERGDMLCGIIFGAITVILGELIKCGREVA